MAFYGVWQRTDYLMGTKGFWGNNEHFDVIAGRGWNPVPTVCARCGFDMWDVLEAAPYARILFEWFYCGRMWAYAHTGQVNDSFVKGVRGNTFPEYK